MAAQVPIVDVSCLFSLSGKSAIVTGGSGGLGLSMTTALASAGADIVSIELPNEPSSSAVASAISKAGRNLRQYHSDIRDSKHLHGVYQNSGTRTSREIFCSTAPESRDVPMLTVSRMRRLRLFWM